MSQRVTLEIPDEALELAREIAVNSQRRLEDVLVEWIDRARTDVPVESLSDEQVLLLCDLQMEESKQAELSDLLVRNREGLLDAAGRKRLDELMRVYRRGLVRKSEAFRVAVERGLRSALG